MQQIIGGSRVGKLSERKTQRIFLLTHRSSSSNVYRRVRLTGVKFYCRKRLRPLSRESSPKITARYPDNGRLLGIKAAITNLVSCFELWPTTARVIITIRLPKPKPELQQLVDEIMRWYMYVESPAYSRITTN